MTATQALHFCEAGLAFAVALQTFELLTLRSEWSEAGPWRWSILRTEWKEFPRSVRLLADNLLSERAFQRLLAVLVGAALALLVLSVAEGRGFELPPIAPPLGGGLVLVLFGGTLAISARFRGAFNGGSDTATVNFLLGCVLGEWIWPKLGLGWICVQITLSYWIAGAVKGKSKRWWSGEALQEFLRSPRYGVPGVIQRAGQSRRLCQFASIGVILFELSFPLIFASGQLLSPSIGSAHVVGTLMIAGLFHLLNFWVFGLNRFFFAWISGYPAILWWAIHRGGL